ncbi:MAG: guanylate kinase [Gammaproteobacteria bacterium]|nr:guanylate kinase [Gammaproteobacteria bacterium]
MANPAPHTGTLPGTLLIVAAPSGAGKTSLVRALSESLAGVAVSVSHTTRVRRQHEQEGVHYHFVDDASFQEMVDAGEFLEHAQVFDRRYGTARATVQIKLAQGVDVILEIDWQGARQVRQHLPQCLSVFILPPSRRALEQRLRTRAQDSEETITSRMRAAVQEMRHYDEFDYLVVNDDFDQALATLKVIVLAGRQQLVSQAATRRELLTSLLA